MLARRQMIVLALLSIFCTMGASYRTTNFVVQAPTPQIAQRIGQLAEHYRKEKAILWLGKEMPRWQQPCPLIVRVTMNGPSGATSFNFGRDFNGNGMVLGQRMEIQGPLERLMASVLPHEITHTVFAYHFRQPVPRWADEGGSVLSEDDKERIRHDQMVRHILNSNQQIQMRRLFSLREYPPQHSKVMCLYAQGYSIANYLVNRSNRQTFLNFIGHGMSRGWDNAVWTYYRHRSVEELESAWLKHLRDTKGQPHIEVVQNRNKQRNTQNNTVVQNNPVSKTGTVVRLTIPPTMSMQPRPTVRGQDPTEMNSGQRFGSGQPIPNHAGNLQGMPTGGGRPRYLPSYQGGQVQNQGQGWHPPNGSPRNNRHVPVRLHPPQAIPGNQNIQGAMTQNIQQVSPVGFPQQ